MVYSGDFMNDWSYLDRFNFAQIPCCSMIGIPGRFGSN